MPGRFFRRALLGVALLVVSLHLAAALVPAPAQARGLSVDGSPLSGAVVPNGSTIRLAAPGAVSVSWVLDGVYAGRDLVAPFELVLSTRPGVHKVKARSEAPSGHRTTDQVRFRTVAATPVEASPSAAEEPTPVPQATASAAVSPPSARPAPRTPSTGTVPVPSSTAPPTSPSIDRAAAAEAPTATVRVTSAAELRSAVDAAAPGHVIELADGVYAGRFVIDRSGTPSEPVLLRGGPGAVLDGGAAASGYALHLDGADHWRLEGFSIRGGQKGVVLDEADHNVLSSLDVGHTGMEAVHFRTSSSDNRLEKASIHDTGLVEPGFGEGVYIGSATSNWGKYGDEGGPDRSDRNVVVDNHVYAVTAENVDVKEGTTGGVISGNTFDGASMTGANYADSWLDLKGNDYLVAGNTGVNTVLDGFQTHVQLEGWGRGNVFRGNRLTVDGGGLGINIHRGDVSAGNVVACDNVVLGAAELANVRCT